MRKIPVLLLIFSLISAAVTAQIPVGKWRSHLTYHNCYRLADAGNRIYAASQNGIFYYDKTSGQSVPLADVSDSGVGALCFDSQSNQLIISYLNGNIDIFGESQIVNIRTLLNARLADKTVHDCLISGDFAYLSGAFGLAVLDLKNQELKEIYAQIGPDGNGIPVYSSAVVGDSVFALSGSILRAARLGGGTNLSDPANWKTLTLPAGLSARKLAVLENNLFLAADGKGIFERKNGNFNRIFGSTAAEFRALKASGNQLLAATESGIFSLGADRQITEKTGEPIESPQDVLTDSEGKIWLADSRAGLVGEPAGALQSFYPSGPAAAGIHRIFAFNNRIVAVAGGYNSSFAPLENRQGFYVFEEEKWRNYNPDGKPAGSLKTPEVLDLVSAAQLPDGRIVFGSYGQGLLEWQPATDEFLHIPPADLPFSYAKVAGLNTDLQGNLWAAIHNVGAGNPSVFRRSPDGNWRPFLFREFESRYPIEVLSDFAGNAWIRLTPSIIGGMLVFNDREQFRYLTTDASEGKLPVAGVTAMVHDRDGHVWVGTEQGIRIFYGASGVLDVGELESAPAVFENREFLNNEKITALAVDGGNRKWIGTENGVWLFDAERSEIAAHFTAANSPLISDKIVGIAVQPTSGEVFFATDKGIVSFRGNATTAERKFADVKVFPNPVGPEFVGPVTVSGLAENAEVKITDSAGGLVFEGFARGGTFSWDGRDLNGRQARAGVYLVLASTNDGNESYVTKFLYLRNR